MTVQWDYGIAMVKVNGEGRRDAVGGGCHRARGGRRRRGWSGSGGGRGGVWGRSGGRRPFRCPCQDMGVGGLGAGKWRHFNDILGEEEV